jgi:hypothetical protein
MSRENQAVCADMARLCNEKETAEHRLSDALRQAAEATQAARAAQVSTESFCVIYRSICLVHAGALLCFSDDCAKACS